MNGDDFYLFLPSNASTDIYPHNDGSSFKIALPTKYELHGDEWQVGLASIVYPHTWINLSQHYTPESLFFARIGNSRRPEKFNNVQDYYDEYWVPLHIHEGDYRTAGDVIRGMERALRVTFGDRLADEEFKFSYTNNHPTITIQRASTLAINPWIVNKLEIAEAYGDQPYGKRYFRQSGLDSSNPRNSYLRLGVDEYHGGFTQGSDSFWLATTLDKPIH